MCHINEKSYVWSPNLGCLLGNPAVLKSSELGKVIPYRYVALLPPVKKGVIYVF